MSATTADLTALAKTFTRSKDDAQKRSQALLVLTANQTLMLMKQYVPVKTGALRDSLRMVVSPGRVEIGSMDPAVDYGDYVEFGTKPHVIRAKAGGFLTFQINGRWVKVKVVNHPGTKPHPYARPAARDALARVAPNYADLGFDLIMGRSETQALPAAA